ncbi:MAG: hypothetical protein FIB01_14700 [Gemmatimonadetes bacterium]|nr:hypothetical protein [Gemmatimonadota bacterium]
MLRAALLTTGLALTVAGAGWSDLAAQGRGTGRGEARATQRFEARSDRGAGSEGRSGGPAFCRSGAGHPTRGRQWCYEQGYGLGDERWSRAGDWDGFAFGRPDGRYRGSRLEGSVLRDILGRVIYGRLVIQSRAWGWGALSGRWLDAAVGPRVLQVQAGGHALAEFYDRDRDGRVDLVMVNLAR